MARYNFDEMIDRRKTDSLKWDIPEGQLPMWVADMDFKTAPEIMDAIKEKADEGAFGYTIVPDRWYDAYKKWWKERHDFTIESEWLMFCTGVIPALSSIVRKMTTVGEKILVQTPVYNIFFNSIVNNGRYIVENSLLNDENGYHINFEELERKLSDTQTTMMILCNPHNPVGRIWSKEELERIGELCYKYGVIVVSDEIHCDITTPGKGYIPFASVSNKCRDISISCVAPTKAFNMAGLQTSAIIVPNERMRAKVNRGINTDEVAEPNYFAIQAAVVAFTKGGEWLDELRTYIYENKMTVKKYIDENLKDVKTEVTDATYLMWIDCRNITDDSKRLAAFIRKNTGLYVSAGGQYGKAGEGYIRMNVACCREVLNDGLERFKNGINMYRKRQN